MEKVIENISLSCEFTQGGLSGEERVKIPLLLEQFKHYFIDKHSLRGET